MCVYVTEGAKNFQASLVLLCLRVCSARSENLTIASSYSRSIVEVILLHPVACACVCVCVRVCVCACVRVVFYARFCAVYVAFVNLNDDQTSSERL